MKKCRICKGRIVKKDVDVEIGRDSDEKGRS